jgi:hypothetical protein
MPDDGIDSSWFVEEVPTVMVSTRDDAVDDEERADFGVLHVMSHPAEGKTVETQDTALL